METTSNKSLSARINSQKKGMHTVTNATYIDTQLATLENMLKRRVLSHAKLKKSDLPIRLMGWYKHFFGW